MVAGAGRQGTDHDVQRTDIRAGIRGAPAGLQGLLAWLEYAGFRLVVGFFRLLPLDMSSALSGWLWRHLAPYQRRHQRALKNVAASLPDLDAASREAIVRDMWEMLGRTFAEALRIDEIVRDPARVEVDIPPDVMDAMRSGGFVIVSLHMGNWELAVPMLHHLGIPAAGLYQRIKNTLVDDFITRMRREHYRLGLFAKGHDSVTALMRVLRQGGGIAVLADLRDHFGERVPFFGREAPSSPFPALLARGRHVPLLAGRVIRLDGCRFRVTAEIVPVERTADRAADVHATTAAIQAVFERWIRERPGQWMWGHRRWG
jgi:Kdo2-lipid IVA lauroyltransferase/acyltransferase